MKLNNKGWGTFQMIWMTGIILFFFLLTILLITKLYKSRGLDLHGTDVVTSKNHEQMLDDLELAAIRYVDYNYKNVSNLNRMRISSNKLFQAGLFAKDLYDGCTGYVIVSKKNNITKADPYIKCSNYKSPGYDKN